MESLTTFLADNTAIRQVPRTIVRLKNLKYLSLCGCRGPPSKSLFSLFWSWIFPMKSPKSVGLLPASLQGLNSLSELNLSHCNLTDDAIPKDLGSLCALQYLDLQNNHFHSLPSSLGGLSKLRGLNLNNCTNLQSITDLPPNLKFMRASHCTTLERMPSLGGLSKLERIYLDNCTNLQSIPDLPPNLQMLGAAGTSLERMPNVSNYLNLFILALGNCNKLAEIPGLDKRLKCIPYINLAQCSNLTNHFKKSILQERALGFDCISLPGNDIPDWFTYTAEGHSVCFEVPRINDRNIDGFTVCIACIVYSSFQNCRKFLPIQYHEEIPYISVINKTQLIHGSIDDGALLMYRAMLHTTSEDHICKFKIIGSGSNLVAGDEVEVKAYFGSLISVKKIGVCLTYDDGDASIDQVAIESKIGLGDDEVESSHGCFEDEQGAKRLRCERNTDDKAESSHGCFDDNREAKRLRYDHSAEMMIDDD